MVLAFPVSLGPAPWETGAELQPGLTLGEPGSRMCEPCCFVKGERKGTYRKSNVLFSQPCLWNLITFILKHNNGGGFLGRPFKAWPPPTMLVSSVNSL